MDPVTQIRGLKVISITRIQLYFGRPQHLHDAAALYPHFPLLMSGVFDLHSDVELGT